MLNVQVKTENLGRGELGEGVEVHHIHHSSLVLVHLIYLHFAPREREELHSGRVSLENSEQTMATCAESDIQHDSQNETRLHCNTESSMCA